MATRRNRTGSQDEVFAAFDGYDEEDDGYYDYDGDQEFEDLEDLEDFDEDAEMIDWDH